MENIGLNVFKFLIEFVWSKINLREFLSKFKYLLVLLLSNVIVSILFIYMAEQAIKRTDEARELRANVVALGKQVEVYKQDYQRVNADLQSTRKILGLIQKTVRPEDMVDDYNSWIKQLEHEREQMLTKTTSNGAKK